MGRRNGLLLPNVAKIIELLKEKERQGADDRELEDLTDLDSRTILKVLAGRRVQKATLEKTAGALNVSVEEIAVESTDGPVQANASQIRVLENWKVPTVAALIAKAQKSIEVVDSILFLDLEWITNLISQAAQAKNANLEVSIYMASPNTKFGAQRNREMGEIEDSSTVIPLFMNEVSSEEEKEYKSVFHNVETRIRQQLGKKPKTLAIFEYLCMPSIRMIAIDGAQFIFGFFPLFDRNPNFPCFFLDRATATSADGLLLEKLTKQIANTKVVSVSRDSPEAVSRRTAQLGKQAE